MNGPLVIRRMQAEDVAGCARWVAATPLWRRYGVTEASMALRFETGLREGATIHVAEQSTRVVGFLWLVERGAFNRSGYVQLIGVHPAARGKGIGHQLIEFAEQVCKPQGDLFLLVSDFNAAAQRFYERLGYREIGRLKDYVIPGVSELVYWKRLRSS